MHAEKAEIGKKYLSKTGIPVTVTGSKGGKFQIRLETTGTTTSVNGDYELRPYDEKSVDKESRILLKLNGKSGNTKKSATLSAIIDPFLLAGNKTVAEVTAELAKKAGEAGKGRDLGANVRARLVTYKRKGWQVIKDEKGHVKVAQKKP